MSTETEITRDDALRVLRREYRQTIVGIARDLYEAIANGHVIDEDDLQRWIHETLDGCHDVIYTQAAQLVIALSDNDGAFFDEWSGIVETDDGLQWSRMAYCTMERDLRDEFDLWGSPFEFVDPAYPDGKAEARKAADEIKERFS